MEKMDKEIKIHKTKVLRETPLPTLGPTCVACSQVCSLPGLDPL